MDTSALATLPAAADGTAAGLLGLAERGMVPDALVRHGIRRLCAQRLRDEQMGGPQAQEERYRQRLQELRGSPIAIHTEAANAQHYELPPEFFVGCLGRRLKYSSAYYPRGDETLDQAEEAMLALYGGRAQLADGQDILELGCGWGSLTLWMAERYPAGTDPRGVQLASTARATSRLNAGCAASRTCRCMTARRQPSGAAGRANSIAACPIEMFEHMRNYEQLLARIAGWLQAAGQALRAHLRAPYAALSVRDRRGRTTGSVGTSSPAV